MIARLSIALALFVGICPAAFSQEAKDLVGTWAQVSNVNTAADGTKSDLFGANPKGQAIYGSDGRFALILHRAELPKFASNNRAQGTPEENKAVVSGMIALYGSYTVANKEIVMKVEGSSFPNWVGTEQRRPISSLSGDELKIINRGGSSGGQNELVFRRIK
jgi:hypothetical protein